MKVTFRWYGKGDPVTLDKIRQIPNLKGIVTSLHSLPAGEMWPKEKILEVKNEIESHGLSLEVIESLPVHEDIKLGLPTRDEYIENYKASLKNLGEVGVKTVCYNFMPVFDWTRTTLDKRMKDGSTALAYDHDVVQNMDPLKESLDLPGWATDYSKEELKNLFLQYRNVGEEDLWENLSYFLKAVVPVAEAHHIKLGMHPDDPPWPLFGLPRIITNQQNLERLIHIIDSESNGLTLCTGSLGVSPENNVPEMVKYFSEKNRLTFLHFRNVRNLGNHHFEETAHLSSDGSVDMYQVMKNAMDAGFDGPIRPDHGRMIWEEVGKPGYGLYDRALGCAYINGLFEAISHQE